MTVNIIEDLEVHNSFKRKETNVKMKNILDVPGLANNLLPVNKTRNQ